MKKPAIFLDRDGVINRDRPDCVKSWAEFEFLPSVLDALRLLAATPFVKPQFKPCTAIARLNLSEAVRCFFGTGMDALVIDGFIIEKPVKVSN